MATKGRPLPQRRSIAKGSPAAISASGAFPLDVRSGLVESMREDEEREIPYSLVLGEALAIFTPNGHKRSVGGQTMHRQIASWIIAYRPSVPSFAFKLIAQIRSASAMSLSPFVSSAYRMLQGLVEYKQRAIKQHSMRG